MEGKPSRAGEGNAKPMTGRTRHTGASTRERNAPMPSPVSEVWERIGHAAEGRQHRQDSTDVNGAFNGKRKYDHAGCPARRS